MCGQSIAVAPLQDLTFSLKFWISECLFFARFLKLLAVNINSNIKLNA